MWAEAKAIQLKAAPAVAGAPGAPGEGLHAPKATPPLYTRDQFRALPKFLSGTFSLPNVREEAAPGNTLYFLIDQKDIPEGPVICAANGTDPEIKCMKVPEAVATLSPGLQAHRDDRGHGRAPSTSRATAASSASSPRR